MNKKIAQSLIDYGLTMTDKNTAYGVKKGFEISVNYSALDSVSPLRIHIACFATALQRSAIENALNNRTDIKGIKKMSEFGLMLGLNDLTAGRLANRLPSILDWTLGMLNVNGALGMDYCAHCGKPLNGGGKKCDVYGMAVTLDEECVATANSLIDTQNQEFNERPNNILKGTLGALIGGIVGALTVVLFFLIDMVSALSGVVAVALGVYLYTKFGGKPNKIMVLIVTVVSIGCLVASVFITYMVAAGILMSREVGFSVSGIRAFNMLMEYEEFSRMFYANLALVILFAVVGMGVYVWALWRKIRLNGKQQHIATKPYTGEQQNASANVDPFAETQTTEVKNDTVAEQAATDNNDSSENM